MVKAKAQFDESMKKKNLLRKAIKIIALKFEKLSDQQLAKPDELFAAKLAKKLIDRAYETHTVTMAYAEAFYKEALIEA